MKYKEILKQFLPNAEVQELEPYGNGHINNTYKVVCKNLNEPFILQKINTDVFKNPQDIIDNHLKLQEFFSSGKFEYEIPQLMPTVDNKHLYVDSAGGVWRLTNFIEDSYSVEVVETEKQALDAGTGFGWFINKCAQLEAVEFKEAIPDFHKLSWRIDQLNEAIKENKAGRLDSVRPIVDFYMNRKDPLLEIEYLTDSNKIPKRIVHNDTKINNLLFRGKKAVAIIDLDTVGPGILFNDYGDALRTISNTANEDEKNLDLVKYNEKAFDSFTKGYVNHIKSILNDKEKELLHVAPVFMTYIMGIRFLADYLNGDVYYKTAYSDHNLVRSLTQKKLIELMELNVDKMKGVISKHLN